MRVKQSGIATSREVIRLFGWKMGRFGIIDDRLMSHDRALKFLKLAGCYRACIM